MVAVIKGDIISSRSISQPEKWLKPLQSLLNEWGKTPKVWELVWGDFFQVEIADPAEALSRAFRLKALIKTILPEKSDRKSSPIDVRLAIGIGEKTYSGKRISESNGPAFIYSGEKFANLKKEQVTLAIQSPWAEFDAEMNLYLRLAAVFADAWSVSSAELIQVVLQNPALTQTEIGKKLGIKQSGVSGRWNRAKTDELLAIERVYRQKIKSLLP